MHIEPPRKTMRFHHFVSNGKEKDYESGFHYYGARYYWGELLTGWLSVDPMMDKYPNISSYNYCVWNPVKLVDPDGREMWKPEILKDGTINYVAEKGDNAKTLHAQYDIDMGKANMLYGMMRNGKISGKDAEMMTGSEILRLQWIGNSKPKKVYHLGFSIIYNNLKGTDGNLVLNDFFSGMPQAMGDNCKIVTSGSMSRKNEQLYIPVIGGKSIPSSYINCSASGKTKLIRDCYGIISKKEGTVRLQMNIYGPKTGCNGVQVIHIQVPSDYKEIFMTSYGN